MKCIYHAYISHVSRYSLDQKKVSSRSRLGHSRVSSRSRLGQFGKRLGLVSVSGAQVSVLVSVSTQKVLGPSLNVRQIARFPIPNFFSFLGRGSPSSLPDPSPVNSWAFIDISILRNCFIPVLISEIVHADYGRF